MVKDQLVVTQKKGREKCIVDGERPHPVEEFKTIVLGESGMVKIGCHRG